MTDKQKRFVEEYLIDLNATQAAIRAGYSPRNADKIGSELLGKTRVSAEVKKRMAEQSKRTGVTADRVLLELAIIGFVNAADVINDKDATIKASASRNDTACVQSVKVKTLSSDKGDMTEREVKLADKVKALDLLGKHLGLWGDKAQEDRDDDGIEVVFRGKEDSSG